MNKQIRTLAKLGLTDVEILHAQRRIKRSKSKGKK